jgi:hypothetical protein
MMGVVGRCSYLLLRFQRILECPEPSLGLLVRGFGHDARLHTPDCRLWCCPDMSSDTWLNGLQDGRRWRGVSALPSYWRLRAHSPSGFVLPLFNPFLWLRLGSRAMMREPSSVTATTHGRQATTVTASFQLSIDRSPRTSTMLSIPNRSTMIRIKDSSNCEFLSLSLTLN